MSGAAAGSRGVHINPAWLHATDYIALLNRAFPGQWDRTAYDWYMGRAFCGARSEILVAAEGSRILAGMAFCYRQIAIDAGQPIDVAVIAAAGTLPEERGRGHYAALLRCVINRACEKRYAAVLGFVTRDNVSGRGLLRTGARAIPSFYIVSPERAVVRGGSRCGSFVTRAVTAHQRKVDFDCVLAGLRRRHVEPGDGRSAQARFHYERADDWTAQFVARPYGVRAIHLAHDSLALIETVGSTDRLQLLACPGRKTTSSIAALATLSAMTGKKFFMYTLDPLQAASARRVGLRIRDGYMMVQPTGYSTEVWNALATASWGVQSGDRL